DISAIGNSTPLAPIPFISKHMSEAKETYAADLTSNQTKASNFPFFTWSRIMKELVTEQSQELMMPSPSAGIFLLREAIAKHLYDYRGMQISPNQVIIGAGTEYLYSLLIQLLGQEKTFAIEDPGYGKIRMIYESNKVNVISIPLDEDGIHMKSLKQSQADILHISPSHHYPTGIITPISRRYELLGWALCENNRYIIEDDYDSEFRFSGRPIPSLQSIDVCDKVIYMNTFTKSLSPTIRISYMVLPKTLMKEFNSRLGFYSCTVSNFEQYTLARFINDGHFEKHINRMRIFYRKQRDMLINAIKKSPLSEYVQIQEKDAGLHFLMSVKTSVSDELLIKKAHKCGLKIRCLSEYYHNSSFAVMHTLVVNYSSLDEHQIDKAIECLLKIFEHL
ncbi:MAG: PLP-dependent aminotransferase family protein, partial [Eubacteriales bacterium]|nr:PLP-dependent aminotransferase family protein [Eubacteriales bacterium]